MVKRVITTVLVLDDLDRKSAAVGSYALAFDGRAVTIDLGEDNLKKLRDFLKPYLRAGSKVAAQDDRLQPSPPDPEPMIAAQDDDPFAYNRRTKHIVIAAFAEANGLTPPRHHGRHGKGNATWYYPSQTAKAFEEARRQHYERQADHALSNGAAAT